jgi:hypothetical protein
LALAVLFTQIWYCEHVLVDEKETDSTKYLHPLMTNWDSSMSEKKDTYVRKHGVSLGRFEISLGLPTLNSSWFKDVDGRPSKSGTSETTMKSEGVSILGFETE